MKKFLLQGITCFFSCATFAQTDQEPCCAIKKIDPLKNIVTARDIETGKLYSFQVNATDIKGFKLNDATAINGGMMTTLGTTRKTYSVFQPDYGEPCCGVVDVKPDPAEPCCGIVNFKNNSTGVISHFKVPTEISSSIQSGQPVYTEPAQNLAIIHSSYGRPGGVMNAYGYPIIQGKTPGTNNWENKPVKGLKRATGRLNLNFPKVADWSIDIYKNDKFIINKSIETWKIKYYDLPAGIYNMKLNTVMIENVSIEEGKETKLHTGLLNINAADWELRSGDDRKFLTSGNRSRTLVLPVGNYILEEGRGNKRTVEVSQVVNPGVFTKKTGDFPLWVIMKSQEASELTDLKGLLSMFPIPKDTTIKYTTPDGKYHSITLPSNIQADIKVYPLDSVLPKVLVAAEIYNGEMYYKTAHVLINNASYGRVPIFENLETRLKVGFLVITKKIVDDNANWLYEHLFGSSQQERYTWELKTVEGYKILTGKKSVTLALPPGKYTLTKSPPEYSTEKRVIYTISLAAGQWVKNGVKQPE